MDVGMFLCHFVELLWVRSTTGSRHSAKNGSTVQPTEFVLPSRRVFAVRLLSVGAGVYLRASGLSGRGYNLAGWETSARHTGYDLQSEPSAGPCHQQRAAVSEIHDITHCSHRTLTTAELAGLGLHRGGRTEKCPVTWRCLICRTCSGPAGGVIAPLRGPGQRRLLDLRYSHGKNG